VKHRADLLLRRAVHKIYQEQLLPQSSARDVAVWRRSALRSQECEKLLRQRQSEAPGECVEVCDNLVVDDLVARCVATLVHRETLGADYKMRNESATESNALRTSASSGLPSGH